jgi:hypothetical protein
MKWGKHRISMEEHADNLRRGSALRKIAKKAQALTAEINKTTEEVGKIEKND